MASFPALTDNLVARLDVPAPRYTSYPTVPSWSQPFGPAEHAAALERAGRTPELPLSLYVHVPFCRRMCSYCGCNVVVARDVTRADPYLDALEREAELVANHLGRRRAVSRLHLGGGTPTFLDEPRLLRLWHAVTRAFDVLPDAELAVEVDPVVTRPEQLRLLADLGWSRISMGVQDLDPEVQRAVGRIQSPAETRASVTTARALGFRSVNLDLIYGLPRQTPEGWQRTLEEVVAIAPDRVAVFSFAYVPDAKPHQRRLPVLDLPRGPAKLVLFSQAYDVLTEAGYIPIGMDHFARPSDELAVAAQAGKLWRDFQGYTTRVGETIALGPSAISDVGGAYAQNEHRLPAYQASVLAGRLPTARGHVLDQVDQDRRSIITRMMCNFEVDLGDEAQRYAGELRALGALEHEGLLVRQGGHVRLTPRGRPFVRNAAMAFDAYLSPAPAARPVFSRAV